LARKIEESPALLREADTKENRMAAFLLWNVDRKPLDGLVQNLVRQLQIDVVLLIEYAFGVSQLPGLLLQDGLYKTPSPERFGVFVRANHHLTRLRYRLGGRAGMWAWTPPSGQEGLLALLHGFDRRNCDDGTRRMFFRRVVDGIRRCERQRGHRRSIIAGDFNAQPFEPAMTDADGLHAIGVRLVAAQSARKVRGAASAADFFYNPMWRVYGQHRHADAAAATHYWLGRNARELGWHMLDQVVLRSEVSPRFPEDRLQIVTQVGGIHLLDADGLPDRQTACDHLPLVFHWNL
jgi:hypothetical protein